MFMFAPCELHVSLCVCIAFARLKSAYLKSRFQIKFVLAMTSMMWQHFIGKFNTDVNVMDVNGKWNLSTSSAKMSPWFTIHHTLTLQATTTECERLAIFDCKIVQINSVNMIFVSQLKIIIILFDGVASKLRRVLFFSFSM